MPHSPRGRSESRAQPQDSAAVGAKVEPALGALGQAADSFFQVDEEPLLAYERAARARVNYILVGPPERNAHPGVEERFQALPERLPLVFKNGTISIYEVR